ncbi:MAG TPA: hypothetical protein VJ885_14525 [Thermoanaerobaculia bacterium]|nr:hypothetical protein [Thermoanaerobaculia bacterium]
MSNFGKRVRLRTTKLFLGLFLGLTATGAASQPPAPPGVAIGTTLAASGRVLASSSEAPGIVSGWNLISLPKQPSDPSPEAAFAPLAGHFTRIFAYDACDAADPWKLYDPASAGTSDLTVDAASGLWIESTAMASLPDDGSASAVTTIHLCPGWNLIGSSRFSGR